MEVHIGVSSFGMSGSVLVRTPYEGSSGPSGLTSLTMSSATAATAVPTGRRSDDNNGFILVFSGHGQQWCWRVDFAAVGQRALQLCGRRFDLTKRWQSC
jgi:hypothetical protein